MCPAHNESQQRVIASYVVVAWNSFAIEIVGAMIEQMLKHFPVKIRILQLDLSILVFDSLVFYFWIIF